MNRLLRAPGGRRIGVLVNDIGEVSIDAALITDATDDLVTLANGCICCNPVRRVRRPPSTRCAACPWTRSWWSAAAWPTRTR